jgi:hypothetical protein
MNEKYFRLLISAAGLGTVCISSVGAQGPLSPMSSPAPHSSATPHSPALVSQLIPVVPISAATAIPTTALHQIRTSTPHPSPTPTPHPTSTTATYPAKGHITYTQLQQSNAAAAPAQNSASTAPVITTGTRRRAAFLEPMGMGAIPREVIMPVISNSRNSVTNSAAKH